MYLGGGDFFYLRPNWIVCGKSLAAVCLKSNCNSCSGNFKQFRRYIFSGIEPFVHHVNLWCEVLDQGWSTQSARLAHQPVLRGEEVRLQEDLGHQLVVGKSRTPAQHLHSCCTVAQSSLNPSHGLPYFPTPHHHPTNPPVSLGKYDMVAEASNLDQIPEVI